MHERLEERIVAATSEPSEPFDVDAVITAGLRLRRRRHVRRSVLGAGGLAAILAGAVFVLPMLAPDGLSIDGLVPVPGASQPTDRPPTVQATERDGVATPEVPDLDVESAVAPYDHLTAVDAQLFTAINQRPRMEAADACVRAQDIAGELPPLPTRSGLQGAARLRFPDIERLERDGLPLEISPPTDRAMLVYFETLADCRRDIPPTTEELRADALYQTVFGAWGRVLDEVDATEEVRSLGVDFTACAIDAGLPPRAARDEASFLGELAGLTMGIEPDEPLDGYEAAFEEHGRLYARCVRDLAEARVRLRLERRPVFIHEHREAIEELSTLMDTIRGSLR